MSYRLFDCGHPTFKYGLPCAVPGCKNGAPGYGLVILREKGGPHVRTAATIFERPPLERLEYERFVDAGGEWGWRLT